MNRQPRRLTAELHSAALITWHVCTRTKMATGRSLGGCGERGREWGGGGGVFCELEWWLDGRMDGRSIDRYMLHLICA